MQKRKTLLKITLITIFLLNLEIFLAYPLEGGLSLALLGCAWMIVLLFRHSEFRVSRISAFSFSFIIYIFFFSSFSYPTPANTFTVFLSSLFYLFVVLLYSELNEEKERLIWENSLIIAGLCNGLLVLLEVISFYLAYSSTKPLISIMQELRLVFRPSGWLFVHPNVFAGFLNFVWPIMLIRMIDAPQKRAKLLWALALAFIGIMLIYTISRGGLIGALFGAILLFYRFLQRELSKNNTPQNMVAQFKSYFFAMGLGAAVVLFLVFGIIWRATQSGQFNRFALSASRILTILDGLSSGRGSLWKHAWQALLEKPFIGHGNAGFPIAYIQSAKPPLVFLPLSAHNLWLNTAVEYGFIGLVIVLLLTTLFFIKMTNYLKETSPKPLNFSDAYLASFIAFLGHHLFDSMLWVSSYLAALIVISVFLIRYTLPFGEWRFARKQYLAFCLLIITITSYSYLSLAQQVAPSFAYLSSEVNQSTLDYQPPGKKPQNYICTLADHYTHNSLYQFQCSMTLVRQIFSVPPEQIDLEKARLALQYQDRGYSYNPYWPPQQANLSVLLWLNGDKRRALEQMRATAINAPKNPLIWANLGWMEEQSGNLGLALEAYDRVLRLNPLLLNSSFIRTSTLFPLASGHLAEWAESEGMWDNWYEQEIVDKAFMRGIIDLALGKPNSALLNFQASAERFPPMTPNYYAYLAYAKHLAGEEEAAGQIAYEIALLDQSNLWNIQDAMILSYVGFILFKNGQEDLAYLPFMNSLNLLVGPSNDNYYRFVYRQPILYTDLSPLLVRNFYLLEETRPGWEWFVEQVSRREPPKIAEQISLSYQQLGGIALLARK